MAIRVQAVANSHGQQNSKIVRRLKRLMKRRLSTLGLLMVTFIIAAAIFAPVIAPYDPTAMIGDISAPPSEEHLFGTDRLGRDVLTRVIYGARISLLIGVGAQSVSILLGVVVGMLSGYFGGVVDMLLMRVVDIFMAFPFILLAIMIVASIGPSIQNVIIAVGLTGWTGSSRIIRGEVLRLREEEFVVAAKALGSSHAHTLIWHIIPNFLPIAITLYTIGIGTAILAEASLSFIGLGVQPPNPSWGVDLAFGQTRILTSPHLAIAPSIAIMVTVLGFNLLGDGLRDAFDPHDAGLLQQ